MAEYEDTVGTAGNITLTVRDLLRFLKGTMRWQLVSDALKAKVIDQALEDNHIAAEKEEVEQALTELRRQNRLLTAQDLEKWLSEHHLSEDDLLQMCSRSARIAKLKESIAGGQLEQAFAFHKIGLEAVEFYKIELKSEAAAQELDALLREGENFYVLAKAYSEDALTSKQCGYQGIIRRRDLRPEVEAALFAAEEGEVVGPVKSLGRYLLFKVERKYPAKFDGETRKFLLEMLFNDWLSARLSDVPVTSAALPLGEHSLSPPSQAQRR